MPTPTRARRLGLAVAALALLAAGACSSGDDSGSDAVATESTSSSSAEATTATATTSTTGPCVLTPADFADVGIDGAGDPVDNGDDEQGHYCSYTDASGANGGIELDVFVDADDPEGVFQTVLAEAGDADNIDLPVEGADESQFQRLSGGIAVACVALYDDTTMALSLPDDGTDAIATTCAKLLHLAATRIKAHRSSGPTTTVETSGTVPVDEGDAGGSLCALVPEDAVEAIIGVPIRVGNDTADECSYDQDRSDEDLGVFAVERDAGDADQMQFDRDNVIGDQAIEDVPDLGDDAFYDPNFEMVRVLVGDHIYSLSNTDSRITDPKGAAIAVAQLLVSNL